MNNEDIIKIEGNVENIIYKDDDKGFGVIEIDYEGELLTAAGDMLGANVGEKIILHGVFTNHPKYGRQFKVSACERCLPATANGILKYLSSGAIKGIGPSFAKKIVQTFGEDTLVVMEKHPERLCEVQGISASKAAKIGLEFSKIFGIRKLMVMLSKYSIGSSVAIKVWKKYGEFSYDMIEENPYRLCSADIGTPFEKCDEIAQQLGFLLSDIERICAACVYVMEHNVLNGHTCLPKEKLTKVAADFTSTSCSDAEKAIERLIEREVVVCEFIEDREYIYLPYLYQAEKYVSNRLNLMLMLDADNTKDYKKQIKHLEDEIGIAFADNQKIAINEALNRKLFILTGGPGTGKTTTINAIIKLMDDDGLNIVLAAPTGRAAQRMSELTGKEAKTIHRLLEVDPSSKDYLRFRHDEKNPLKADVVIIDEMSMVDITLMESLLRGIRMGAKLILVGDYDQLPSVGAGTVLKDMIECNKIKTIHLDEVFRQAAKSLIVTNAHKIVNGSMPDVTIRDNDFFFMQRNNNSSISQTVVDLCTTRLPKTYSYSPLWDIQIICPTRIGEVGTQRLNVLMQQQINPPSSEKIEINVNGIIFRCGDKIMQTKNNYDIVWMDKNNTEGSGIYNGDIGIINQIDKGNKTVIIAFSDKTAAYDFDEMTEIEHAYAITVHKSQGSEFEAVILPIMPYKSKMYYRNVLYTAVTRGKSLLIIVGNYQTLSYMVDENRKTVRYTNLLSFLQDNNSQNGSLLV
ncbi:MAG: ATP-dependent RecD-like DNA helicase [Oscillospiraceae bacterium]